MGRRHSRRRPTRAEKAEGRIQEPGVRRQELEVRSQEATARGRIGFDDLSNMTQEVVSGIAKLQRCTIEEIVETLND